MQNIKEKTVKRIQNVLYNDKLQNPDNFKKVLKLEIISTLSHFMNINPEEVNLSILLDPAGVYKINIQLKTNYIKPVGNLSL